MTSLVVRDLAVPTLACVKLSFIIAEVILLLCMTFGSCQTCKCLGVCLNTQTARFGSKLCSNQTFGLSLSAMDFTLSLFFTAF